MAGPFSSQLPRERSQTAGRFQRATYSVEEGMRKCYPGGGGLGRDASAASGVLGMKAATTGFPNCQRGTAFASFTRHSMSCRCVVLELKKNISNENTVKREKNIGYYYDNTNETLKAVSVPLH